MRETFSLDGESCEDYGIRLQRPLSFTGAKARVETVSIPGRNGDLHISDGSYDNVTGTAECFALQEDVAGAVEAACNWLMGKKGYCRLEVSDDPGAFRLARLAQSPAREFRMRRLAPFSLEFDCAPQRFLHDGEFSMPFATVPNAIFNPTSEIAKPLVTVYGTGPGQLHIGGVVVEILELIDQVTLDCQMQNAYRQVGSGGVERKNHTIHASVFPSLKPGDNAVSWTGDIERIEIIPRWWTT